MGIPDDLVNAMSADARAEEARRLVSDARSRCPHLDADGIYELLWAEGERLFHDDVLAAFGEG